MIDLSELADRLAELNAVFMEDEGRDLDAVSVRAAHAFAARYAAPESVSAGSDGAVYFTWRKRGNLAVQFTPSGTTLWAGKLPSGSRPYGSGDPDPALWPCLRTGSAHG